MSWGERSCKKPCRCPERCTIGTCNVDCPDYVYDGCTAPDSVSFMDIEIMDKCPEVDKNEVNKYLQFRRERSKNQNKRFRRKMRGK